MINNRSYVKKVCYNIRVIDLTEKQKIEEFKIEITKTIKNLTENHNQYHIVVILNAKVENFTKPVIKVKTKKVFVIIIIMIVGKVFAFEPKVIGSFVVVDLVTVLLYIGINYIVYFQDYFSCKLIFFIFVLLK